MRTKFALACCVLMLAVHVSFAEETDPNEIFKKAQAAYHALDSYSSEGTVVADIVSSGITIKMETTFSIKLKKPNWYLITWEQKQPMMPGFSQTGAVWNDGQQAYAFMDVMKGYFKMNSDELALAAATGVSGGAANTIPMLFLSTVTKPDSLLAKLADPKLEPSEQVEGDDCYVISGSTKVSKKETYWISKTTFLIRKFARSLEAPEGGRTVPELTDQQLEETIKASGQPLTDEVKAKVKKMMQDVNERMKTSDLKGASVETHAKIQTPKLTAEDFSYQVPAGTVLKDSFFGSALNQK